MTTFAFRTWFNQFDWIYKDKINPKNDIPFDEYHVTKFINVDERWLRVSCLMMIKEAKCL